jgi:hypothetical protein
MVSLTLDVDDQLHVTARASDDTEAHCQGQAHHLSMAPVPFLLEQVHQRRAEPAQLQELGQILFEQLFQEKVLGLLRTCEERARVANVPLWIRLALQPRWQMLPWELLFDREAAEFMALSADKALFRLIRGQTTANTATRPASIAILAAAPRDQDPLDVGRELFPLQKALRRARLRASVEKAATRRSLNELIENKKPGILHFIGHGRYQGGQGAIALHSESGDTDWLSESDLSIALMGCNHVGLVTLNACETGTSERANTFMGLGARLAQTRVPAVVAMQYRVRDRSAAWFSEAFYQQLAQGRTVPEAVQAARKQLALELGAGERDAFAPILYARGEAVRFAAGPGPAQAPGLAVPSIPSPTPHLILPPRTLELLEQALSAPGALLLSAEGGYGKTEIGRSLAQKAGACVWLEGQGGYVEPASLLLDLAYRLQEVSGQELSSFIQVAEDPKLAETPLGRVRQRLTQVFIAELEKLEAPCLLVMDDLHALPASVVEDVIAPLARQRPKHLRLVLINGGPEPGSLATALEERKLVRIDRQGLAFGAREVESYLRGRFSKAPGEALCARLAEATDGWPMALALLDERDVSTDEALESVIRQLQQGDEDVYSIMLRRAYSRQDEETRAVLRAMGVTRWFTPAWVNAVIGTASGGAMLRELSSQNAFLMRSQDLKDSWRLHSLFRTFLRMRGREEHAEEAEKTFQRSQDFLASKEQWLLHLLNALDHGALEQAAETLEKLSGPLVDQGRRSAFLSFALQLPASLRAARPRLAFEVAAVHSSLAQFEQAYEALNAVTDWSSAPELVLRAALKKVWLEHIFQPMGQLDAQIERFEELIRRGRSAGDAVFVAEAISLRAKLQLLRSQASQVHGQVNLGATVEELKHSSQELLAEEERLRQLGTPEAREWRGYLLREALHFECHAFRTECTKDFGRAHIAHILKELPPVEERSRKAAGIMARQRELSALFQRALQAAKESGNAKIEADVLETWADATEVLTGLVRQFRKLGLPFPPDQEQIERVALDQARSFVARAASLYQRFELLTSFLGACLLMARLSRLAGDMAMAQSALDSARPLANQVKVPWYAEEIQRIESGFYDPEYVEDRTVRGTAFADMDDAHFDQLCQSMFRDAGHTSLEAQVIERDLRELRACHLARRDWCRHIDILYGQEERHPAEGHVPGLVKRIQCRRYPQRTSLFPSTDIQTLLTAFRGAFCTGCEAREPAPPQKPLGWPLNSL